MLACSNSERDDPSGAGGAASGSGAGASTSGPPDPSGFGSSTSTGGWTWPAGACTTPADAAAAPIELAKVECASHSIALDDAHVYWTCAGAEVPEGRLQRVAKAGGPVEVLAPFASAAVAVDETRIYWNGLDGVSSLDKLGGEPFLLTSEVGTQVALDDAHVYAASLSTNRIWQVPKDGGAVVTLADAQDAPQSLHAGPTGVHWTNYGVGRVMRLAPGAPAPVVLADGQEQARGLAVDGDGTVYWTLDADPGAVMKLAPGETVPAVVAANQCGPAALVVDDVALYWVIGGGPKDADGSVVKLDKAGGGPVIIAGGQAFPRALAVDGTSVYWVSGADGTVMKADK